MTAETDTGITWYVAMTGPREEFIADENLRRLGYMTWLPHERIRRRRKLPNVDRFRIDWVNEPHFPRYLFVALRKPTESLYQVNETDGIATVVYCGPDPLPVPHRVMDELMARADEDGLVGVVDRTARNKFAPGAVVRFVEESPLRGLLAAVDIDTGPNVRVWVSLLGKKQSVSVAPNTIEAA
ncbi:MAG TPA: transcription termination/antitermination NusG family protein [Nitrospiraceae bacterium]